MVEYVHDCLGSFILTKTWCIDMLFDFNPTFKKIKNDPSAKEYFKNKDK